MKYDNLVSLCIALTLITGIAIVVPILWYFNDQNGVTLESEWKVIKSNLDTKSCKELGQTLLDVAQQPFIDVKDNKFYDEQYRYIEAKLIAGDCK